MDRREFLGFLGTLPIIGSVFSFKVAEVSNDHVENPELVKPSGMLDQVQLEAMRKIDDARQAGPDTKLMKLLINSEMRVVG